MDKIKELSKNKSIKNFLEKIEKEKKVGDIGFYLIMPGLIIFKSKFKVKIFLN
jgi:hypothetical protein